MDLADLTLASFAPAVGEAFALGPPAVSAPPAVQAEDSEASDTPHGLAETPHELMLIEAVATGHPPTGAGREPFRLTFLGPAEPLLPQAIYPLTHASTGTLEIFIVPIGRDEQGTRYEAIFS